MLNGLKDCETYYGIYSYESNLGVSQYSHGVKNEYGGKFGVTDNFNGLKLFKTVKEAKRALKKFLKEVKKLIPLFPSSAELYQLLIEDMSVVTIYKTITWDIDGNVPEEKD